MDRLAIRLISVLVCLLIYWVLVEYLGFPLWVVFLVGGLLLIGGVVTRKKPN